MSGRRRVEDDVIITLAQRVIGQEFGELIESGDFGRAGAGELFLNALQRLPGQDAAHWADDTFAILGCGGLGINFERIEAVDAGDGGDLSPISVSKTWPTLEAGSVLTTRTRFPASANASAVAQASEVFPTPPLPVKKTNFGRFREHICSNAGRSAPGLAPQQHFFFSGSAGCTLADPPQQDPASAFGSAEPRIRSAR